MLKFLPQKHPWPKTNKQNKTTNISGTPVLLRLSPQLLVALSSLYLDPQPNAWSPLYAARQSDANDLLVLAKLSKRSHYSIVVKSVWTVYGTRLPGLEF